MSYSFTKPIRLTRLLLAASLAMSANALAIPIGDSYTITLQNFPIDLAASDALTFNATADLSQELTATGSITVNEQFIAGGGASGGDLLTFRFVFNQTPTDVTAPFAFSINGLDWSDGGDRQLLKAFVALDFGVSAIPATDVTALTTASNSGGLRAQFLAPSSWASVYGLSIPPANTLPTQLITTFSFEVSQVPEPSIGSLMLTSFVLMLALRQRRAGEAGTLTK